MSGTVSTLYNNPMRSIIWSSRWGNQDREVKPFIQGYMAHKRRSQDLNPGDMIPVPVLFLTTPHPAAPRIWQSWRSILRSQAHSSTIYWYLSLGNLFNLWVSVFFLMKWVQQKHFVELCPFLDRVGPELYPFTHLFPLPSSLICLLCIH